MSNGRNTLPRSKSTEVTLLSFDCPHVEPMSNESDFVLESPPVDALNTLLRSGPVTSSIQVPYVADIHVGEFVELAVSV